MIIMKEQNVISRRKFLKSVIRAGAGVTILAAGGCKLKQPNESLMVFDGFDDPLYSIYDKRIMKGTGQWNKEFGHVPGIKPMDPNLFKAVVLQESGGHPDTAFLHDPSQIANKGDYALRVLSDGLEPSIPEGGYEDLQGIEETPGRWVECIDKEGKERREWVWDYKSAPNRIKADLSIEYGIRWLFQKAFKFQTRTIIDEDSPMLSYEVKPEDYALSIIAQRCGTTVDVFEKYNDIIRDPDLIKAGWNLKYRPAKRGKVITGVRPWYEAVAGYNGGGTEGYADSVYSKLASARKP